jgi:hypothetical protein
MEQTELNKILAEVGRTVVQQPKTVEVDIRPKNWLQKLLIKKGFLKPNKVFTIYPILVGNRFRISTVALNIPDAIFSPNVEEGEIWKAIKDHTNDLIYVVAVCIQNNKKEPSKALLDYLRWIDDAKFYELLDASLSMIGVPNFTKSIILIRGQNVISGKDADVTPAITPE